MIHLATYRSLPDIHGGVVSDMSLRITKDQDRENAELQSVVYATHLKVLQSMRPIAAVVHLIYHTSCHPAMSVPYWTYRPGKITPHPRPLNKTLRVGQ
jgi:hypothetical protein